MLVGLRKRNNISVLGTGYQIKDECILRWSVPARDAMATLIPELQSQTTKHENFPTISNASALHIADKPYASWKSGGRRPPVAKRLPGERIQ